MLVIINIESILLHRQASHTGYTMTIIHTPVYGAVEACRTHWHRLHTLHCSVGCEILASSHAWWGLRAHTACKICAAHRPHHIDPTTCYSLRTHAGGKPGKAKPIAHDQWREPSRKTTGRFQILLGDLGCFFFRHGSRCSNVPLQQVFVFFGFEVHCFVASAVLL